MTILFVHGIIGGGDLALVAHFLGEIATESVRNSVSDAFSKYEQMILNKKFRVMDLCILGALMTC